MGCFNTSCAFSGISITYGSAVVGIPIMIAYDGGEPRVLSSRPTSRYVAAGFPIFGTYDSYGGMTVDDESQFGYAFFKETFPKTNFSDSFNLRGPIETVYAGHRSERTIGWMFILRTVYDSIVNVDFKTFLGDPVPRQQIIDESVRFLVNKANVKRVFWAAFHEQPLPEHLQETNLGRKIKYYAECYRISLDNANAYSALTNEEFHQIVPKARDYAFRSYVETPESGYYIDDETGETLRISSLIRQMEMSSSDAPVPYSVLNSATEMVVNAQNVREHALSLVNAYYDLIALCDKFYENGVQYSPSMSVGQTSNVLERFQTMETLMAQCWDLIVEECHDGCYDEVEWDGRSDTLISRIEKLLTKMKADAKDASYRINKTE